ncbi:MAG: polymerase, sigma-24 subunit, subfamily [Akkermansiaceae bacterium]|nr:polymerase, sigma-24 subunit, subfamily [Akkermansiaceae bacterium]
MIAEMHLSPFDRYLQSGNQQAFATVVREHLPLVHSAALRLTRDAGLAEEVSQTVFIRLAALGNGLPKGLTLPVWLHRVTRSVSIDMIRTETRRRRRETTAAATFAGEGGGASAAPFAWEKISPVIDEVIARLPAADRELVLSRFFTGCSHAAIAATLGLSEDAVRMRLKRAVEKMRGLLERRGIVTSSALLALCLPAHAAPVVPDGLQTAVLKVLAVHPLPTSGWLIRLTAAARKEILIGAGALSALAAVVLVALAVARPFSHPSVAPAVSKTTREVIPAPPLSPPADDPAAALLELKQATASKSGPPLLLSAPVEDDPAFRLPPAGRQLEVVLRRQEPASARSVLLS